MDWARPESSTAAATAGSMVSNREEEDVAVASIRGGGRHETPPLVEAKTFFSNTRKHHHRNISIAAAERMLDVSSTTTCEGAAGPAPIAASHPVPEFVCHLYSMLLETSYSDLISWIVPTEDEPLQMGGGISGIGKIVVHNPEALQDGVLGSYYRHSKYASFQRQLNYFGFKKRLHSGKKGKLSPCSYIHESLTADMGSLFTLKRRPPSRRRPSEVSVSTLTSTPESDSTDNEAIAQDLCEDNFPKRTCRNAKRSPRKRKMNSKKQAIAEEPRMKQANAEAEVLHHFDSPLSLPSVITSSSSWESKHFEAQYYASGAGNRRLRLPMRASASTAEALHPHPLSLELSSSGQQSAPPAVSSEKQPTLVELLSKSLPPSDILFNDDGADSVDEYGVPAWVGEDGLYHYHNVDNHLVDLAMLY